MASQRRISQPKKDNPERRAVHTPRKRWRCGKLAVRVKLEPLNGYEIPMIADQLPSTSF